MFFGCYLFLSVLTLQLSLLLLEHLPKQRQMVKVPISKSTTANKDNKVYNSGCVYWHCSYHCLCSRHSLNTITRKAMLEKFNTHRSREGDKAQSKDLNCVLRVCSLG